MRNSAKQVFKGGWEELANAIHTDNVGSFPTSAFQKSYFIKPDGTLIFVIKDTIVEVHAMSIPYDVSTIGAVVATFPITVDSSPSGIAFTPDGSSMIVSGQTNKILYQFTLPTPWDVTSIVAAPTTMSLSVMGTFIRECMFSRDGDFVFVNDSVEIFSFPLPTPFDITSNVSNTKFTPPAFPDFLSFFFKPEGDKLYIYDSNTGDLTEYDLPTINDITTATPTGKTITDLHDLIGIASSSLFLFFRSNGMELFALDESLNDIYKLHLDESWDITTASYFSNINAIPTADPRTISWKPDGSKYFIGDHNADTIAEFTTLHPWNQTGATQTASFPIAAIQNRITGMWWNLDGTHCYIIGLQSDRVNRLNVSTPWDVSTMSNPGISIVPTNLQFPTGICLNKDESKVYISNNSSPDTINEYELITPGDITTISFIDSLDVSTIPTAVQPQDLILKSDEKMIYVASITQDRISRFSWDSGTISNAVFEDFLDISAEETIVMGLFIRQHDGKKLYIVGSDSLNVISYDMSINLVP